MVLEWSPKKAFLRMLIIALVSSALVGIDAFLFGDFGETEAKILMTTLSISYFSVTSLACAAAMEKRVYSWLAIVGLVVCLIGFVSFIPGIWAEWWGSEAIGKTMVIIAIFAFSFAQVCLLALVPLQGSIRWLFFATSSVIFTLATLGSGIIVFEVDDEWLLRLLGVLGILDGCGSLLIPVLFKLGSRAVTASDDGKFKYIELACPRCGHRATYPMGVFTCAECSLEMSVQVNAQSKTLAKP
jgi:hypothetical protein